MPKTEEDDRFFGTLLGPSWRPLGAVLAASWARLARLGGLLGLSWPRLGGQIGPKVDPKIDLKIEPSFDAS